MAGAADIAGPLRGVHSTTRERGRESFFHGTLERPGLSRWKCKDRLHQATSGSGNQEQIERERDRNRDRKELKCLDILHQATLGIRN